MKTATQICRENARLLGGIDNAFVIAESITNNDTRGFIDAIKPLPEEAYGLINLLRESIVPSRNQR